MCIRDRSLTQQYVMPPKHSSQNIAWNEIFVTRFHLQGKVLVSMFESLVKNFSHLCTFWFTFSFYSQKSYLLPNLLKFVLYFNNVIDVFLRIKKHLTSLLALDPYHFLLASKFKLLKFNTSHLHCLFGFTLIIIIYSIL